MVNRTLVLAALALTACTELPGSKYAEDGGSIIEGDGGEGDVADGVVCPSREALIAHNLRRLNELRAGRWSQKLEPLKTDICLEEIAARSLDAWLAGGRPHGLFERECLPRVPECECYWEQENVGWSEGQTWKRAIDHILGQMMAEEFYDGGHFRNIVAPGFKLVGIAVDCRVDGGRLTLRLANEFAP